IPTITIKEGSRERIMDYARRIARALLIKGPFNIQFLVKNGEVQVIECNLRASRSMPFVSKMTGTNLMDLAAKAIMGEEIPDGEGKATGFGGKAPQFSFTRLAKADPVTGVEIVSTGEAACFVHNFQYAFLTVLVTNYYYVPRRLDSVLTTI